MPAGRPRKVISVKDEEPAEYIAETFGGMMLRHVILTINTVSRASDKEHGLFNVDEANKLMSDFLAEGYQLVGAPIVITRPTYGDAALPNTVQLLYVMVKQ